MSAVARATAGVNGRRARHPSAASQTSNSLLVHDIKNLSFRLNALLQNLATHYEDPEFKKSVVEILGDTVGRMDRIVHRFRERKDDVVVKIPVNLNEIVEKVIASIPRAVQARTHVLVEAHFSRVPRIWGDPEFLREALTILVENALEAMADGGGRLILATGVAPRRGGGREVVVTVADTGCGMSGEFVRQGLFAPFVSTKEQGLGMGLYACRRIVALHDGRIRVRSREGKGTTFRLAFRVT